MFLCMIVSALYIYSKTTGLILIKLISIDSSKLGGWL